MTTSHLSAQAIAHQVRANTSHPHLMAGNPTLLTSQATGELHLGCAATTCSNDAAQRCKLSTKRSPVQPQHHNSSRLVIGCRMCAAVQSAAIICSATPALIRQSPHHRILERLQCCERSTLVAALSRQSPQRRHLVSRLQYCMG